MVCDALPMRYPYVSMFGSLDEGVIYGYALAGVLLVNIHLFLHIKPIQRITDVLNDMNGKSKPKPKSKSDLESQTENVQTKPAPQSSAPAGETAAPAAQPATTSSSTTSAPANNKSAANALPAIPFRGFDKSTSGVKPTFASFTATIPEKGNSTEQKKRSASF